VREPQQRRCVRDPVITRPDCCTFSTSWAGLRTLVVGSRVLTEKQYEVFASALRHAKATLHDRQANVQVPYHILANKTQSSMTQPCFDLQAVADTLEEDIALLGVTGVDDRLQVPPPPLPIIQPPKPQRLFKDVFQVPKSLNISSRMA
jgi:hypothetical protein